MPDTKKKQREHAGKSSWSTFTNINVITNQYLIINQLIPKICALKQCCCDSMWPQEGSKITILILTEAWALKVTTGGQQSS